MNPVPGFKLAYVILLAKPSVCGTWLPWDVADRDCGNFFANPECALDYARKLVSRGPRKFLPGTKEIALWEFTLGYVMLNEPAHIIKGPLPEPQNP